MKILLIRNAFQQDAGGAEQYALNLAVALKKLGHSPTLITNVMKIKDKAGDSSILVKSGPWHESQEWDRFYFIRFPLITLWYMWFIVKNKIDAVHPQGRDDFIFATYAGWLLRKPVIWTDHADLKVVLNNQRFPFRHMRRWIINAANKAKKIIIVSKAEMEEVINTTPDINKSKLTLIYNGVFKPSGISPIEKRGLVVGTSARLVPDKGIAELIEGFANSKYKNGELWLMGGESGNKILYEEVANKHGVKDKVKILGYVNNPDDYIASMDVFVHASYHEAFSLAIVEAAMLKRPIIATDVGGASEIIDEYCGILIPPMDSKAITSALNKLYDDPKLAKNMAENAYNKAASEFDLDKIVKEKILPLYTRD